MESGAKGAAVTVSGKVRGQRAKSQKFDDGYMIKSGRAKEEYVDEAVRHVMMRQGVLRFVMESGAKGASVTVSGKVRGQRAKGQKFDDGYMIKSGRAKEEYVDTAVRHVMMRQGVLGVK